MGAISIDAFGVVINSTDPAARFFVGMENNVNGGRGFGTAAGVPVSDRDYNDFTISVPSVPEPDTLGLMGVGLLVLAGIAAKRRKSQASH